MPVYSAFVHITRNSKSHPGKKYSQRTLFIDIVSIQNPSPSIIKLDTLYCNTKPRSLHYKLGQVLL